jgi:hypothetical protein
MSRKKSSGGRVPTTTRESLFMRHCEEFRRNLCLPHHDEIADVRAEPCKAWVPRWSPGTRGVK